MTQAESNTPPNTDSPDLHFSEEADRLGRSQAGTIALQDAVTYLRNTYIVSTAAAAQALTASLKGDPAAQETLSLVAGYLDRATEQLEKVARISAVLETSEDEGMP